MSGYNFMKAIGLTNHESPDLSEIAGARVESHTVAFCDCGNNSISTNCYGRTTCPNCRKTLYWETLTPSIAKRKFIRHRAKVARDHASTIVNNQTLEIKTKQDKSYRYFSDDTMVEVPINKKLASLLPFTPTKVVYDFSSKTLMAYNETMISTLSAKAYLPLFEMESLRKVYPISSNLLG